MAFLEGVYHLRCALRFQQPVPFPVRSYCLTLVLAGHDVSSQIMLQHHVCPPAAIQSYDGHGLTLSGTVSSKIKGSLL